MLLVCKMDWPLFELLRFDGMLIWGAVHNKVTHSFGNKLCSLQVKLATTICGDPENVFRNPVFLCFQSASIAYGASRGLA